MNHSKIILSLSLICVMLFNSSCAMLFNKKDVEVTFASYPENAKVFLDGNVIGHTPVTVRIKPKYNADILYIKEGYANREFEIERVVGDSTLRPTFEHTMCILDAVSGVILILPFISAFSTSCAHFDKTFYHKALDEGVRLNTINQHN